MFFPTIAYAADGYEVIGKINQAIVNPLIRVLFAVALLVFLWGILQMLTGRDDAEKLVTGRRHMFWGIIGLAIMVSVFGIIQVIINFVAQF